MNQINIEWLVNPYNKNKLTLNNDELTDGVNCFTRKMNYWDLTPYELIKNKPEWKTWEELQKNGMVSYEEAPQSNLGVGVREDYESFARFCSCYGLVLDVGCGPQSNPTHINAYKGVDVQFVGIDPLEGEEHREFIFIQGLAEYLPFKKNLFDQVLFTTTLDHFIDPIPALKEAMRCLKVDGEICVWLGEKSPNSPKPKVSYKWYEDLSVPKGADDRFHYKKFTTEDFESFCDILDLKIKSKEIIEVDEWRKNLFYKLTK